MEKVIFFDLYQTLLDVELSKDNPNKEIQGWNAFAKNLEKYRKITTGTEIQNLYIKRRNDFYLGKNENVHHNMMNIVKEILKNDLGLHLSKEEIISLIYEYRKASRGWLRLYPNVLETLENLSTLYILAVASHTQGSFTQIELKEIGIAKFFTFFGYTSNIGYKKSKEFYKECLKSIGKSADDCMMIGDNYHTDVEIPMALGMKAIWLKNPNEIKNLSLVINDVFQK